jgi:hypothetical protein
MGPGPHGSHELLIYIPMLYMAPTNARPRARLPVHLSLLSEGGGESMSKRGACVGTEWQIPEAVERGNESERRQMLPRESSEAGLCGMVQAAGSLRRIRNRKTGKRQKKNARTILS